MSIERIRCRGRRFACEPAKRGLCSLDDGGGSTSSSNQSTTTNNIDRRIAAGPGAIVSGDSSPITVSTGDYGAIHEAFGFASNVQAGALESAHASLDAVTASEKQVADAYGTAKAGEQKVLVGVAIALVALVAVASLKGLKRA